MTELGYPDVYLDGWFGVGGPAELPDETVRALHGKFASVLNSPDLNRRLKEQGWVVDPITPDAFRRLIESDIVRLGQLLKDTGAKFGEGPQ
jgi:tripartite-type tricarboxylate transporter receptor subunit TctC